MSAIKLLEEAQVALRAMLVMSDRGPQPNKFDAALSWRDNDIFAHKLANTALDHIDALLKSELPVMPVEPAEEMFYLQDSRGYVGNDVLWWRVGGGYTTDLSKARLYDTDAAAKQHRMRDTDIPWPKEYIDRKTRPAVDMQYIRRDLARLAALPPLPEGK